MKQKKGGSLRIQLLLIMVVIIVITCTLVSIIGGVSSHELATKKTHQTLTNKVFTSSSELNTEMSKVEISVAILADTVMDNLNWDKFKSSDSGVDELTEKVRQTAIDCAKNTEGTITYYVRYNPELAYPTSGIFAQVNDSGEYDQLTPTDFTAFNKEDAAVSWYYTPVNNGEPIWMSPYYNENINVYMVSYVIPLFYNGESIGIVGMDISLEKFNEITEKLNTNSEAGFLLTKENTTLNHAKLEDGSEFNHQLKKDSGFTTIDDEVFVYDTLRNGFKIVLSTDVSKLKKDSTELTKKLVIGSVIGIIFGIIIAYIFISRMIKPLKKVTEMVDDMGKYNLVYDAELAEKLTKCNNEIGQIASAVNLLRGGLTETVEKLVSASALLSDASDDLAVRTGKTSDTMDNVNNACTEIAEGALSQAENTSNASRSVMNMGELIDQTRLILEELRNISADVRQSTEYAGDKLSNVKELNQQVTEVTDVIERSISETSISADKIKTAADAITNIAEQTNLLSLNASIEAARAGEAGRGFAVVAGEIQKLSQESNTAAMEIRHIIEELVMNSNQSVEDIKSAQEIAGVQTQKLDEALNEFLIVKEGIIRSLEGIECVASATAKIDVAKTTVNETVVGLSAIAQENAASTQETAASIAHAKELVMEINDKALDVAETASKLKADAEKWTI